MKDLLLLHSVIFVIMAFPAFYISGKKVSSVYVFISGIFLSLFLLMNSGLKEAVTAALLMFVTGFAVLFFDNESDNKGKNIALIIAAIAALSFFTGCTGEKTPALLSGKNISTGFIPSKIFADENAVYAARLSGTEVFAINPYDSEVIARYSAGRNVTSILIHNGIMYTANKLSSSVSVIDLSSGKQKEIKTDLYTSALALDQENNILYAANTGESNVSVIDTENLKVTGKIITGKWPSYLYLDGKKKLLFIACKYTNTLEIFDIKKGQMVFTEAHTGISPVAVLPVAGGLAVLNEWEYAVNGKGTLTLFDTDGYTVSNSIQTAGGITGGDVSKSGRYVYCCVPLKDKVCVVDILKGRSAAEINMPGFMPSMCALSKDGSKVYVAGLRQSYIEIINTNGMN